MAQAMDRSPVCMSVTSRRKNQACHDRLAVMAIGLFVFCVAHVGNAQIDSVVFHVDRIETCARFMRTDLRVDVSVYQCGDLIHLFWELYEKTGENALWHTILPTDSAVVLSPSNVDQVGVAHYAAFGITCSEEGPLVAWLDDEGRLNERQWLQPALKWSEIRLGPPGKPCIGGRPHVFRMDFGAVLFRPVTMASPRVITDALLSPTTTQAASETTNTGDIGDIHYMLLFTGRSGSKWWPRDSLVLSGCEGLQTSPQPKIFQRGATSFDIFTNVGPKGSQLLNEICLYTYDFKLNTLAKRCHWRRQARIEDYVVMSSPAGEDYFLIWKEIGNNPADVPALFLTQTSQTSPILCIAKGSDRCDRMTSPSAVFRKVGNIYQGLLVWVNHSGDLIACQINGNDVSTTKRIAINADITDMELVLLDDQSGVVVASTSDRIILFSFLWKNESP